MRICKVCQQEKPLKDFYKQSTAGQWFTSCKGCCRDQYRKTVANRRESSPDEEARTVNVRAARVRQRVYGLDACAFTRLRINANDRCQLCGAIAKGKALHIDHDHECCPGKGSCGECVRGLLCHSCNVGLGHFKDNAALLKAAQEYLERPPHVPKA